MSPWVIVGLGNPGPQYAGNRHNVGAMVVAELARRHGADLRPHKSRTIAGSTRLGFGPGGVPGPAALLAVPMSYMNESGGPVKSLLSFFGVEPAKLVVVHDDLDLVAATLRLKRGGSDGGHNGLRSITRSLGTGDYTRVRVGIGRPPGRMDPADFVLQDFSPTERADLPWLLGDAADAVESVVTEGLSATQQRFHAPPRQSPG